jgi:hypothetical protein
LYSVRAVTRHTMCPKPVSVRQVSHGWDSAVHGL